MSTADDAYEMTEADFQTFEPKELFGYSYGYKDGLTAGYRRALEDAADACKKWRHDPDAAEFIEKWLRDRAAGVGTKDGDDDRG